LSPLSDRRLVRIAVIGAFVAALGLAGCGRKAGLDPPPAASVAGEPSAAVEPSPGPAIAPDGRALAPAQGPRRRTPIDWLLE
jgi:predicted small lipoprotein YifL